SHCISRHISSLPTRRSSDLKFVAITGPNGSGKSTLAKLIAGIIHPTAGRIILDGEDITDLNITERANKGISYAFQQPVHFKGLRSEEHTSELQSRFDLVCRL